MELVKTLRGPDGCPRDRAQTAFTLAPYLVEESFEVLHAVENGGDEGILEEAGDLAFVLSLFLHTAEQEGRGETEAALGRTVRKIEARHPHVFAGASSGSGSEADVSKALQLEWERLKQSKGPASEVDETADRLHRLPPPHPALPALAQAAKLQGKAANLGFDWPEIAPVFAKVREELAELEEARSTAGIHEVREELGDLLFAVVNLARFLGVEPESALRRANEKFRNRFHGMLHSMEADGLDPTESSLETMDAYWEKTKSEERKPRPE
ncbi:MAG: nucleoside triphosphate pyrophosphohydrolase [Candidatus Eisenbacteria bacterium]